MALTVTFDTNSLDKACRPERYPKDPSRASHEAIRDAIRSGQIQGRFSVTMLTLEGIQKTDRIDVYAGTRLSPVDESEVESQRSIPASPDANVEVVTAAFRVEQPDRKPLHPEMVRRVNAARQLGLLALKAVPRAGAFAIEDPDNEFYLPIPEDVGLSRWLERVHEIGRKLEARGVGSAQIRELAQGFITRVGRPMPWFAALAEANDVHERNAVSRAVAEWADGDTIASHIAYGVDVFCTSDIGNSNAQKSVLDAANREWLADSYSVRFMTLEELAESLSAM